MAESSKINSLYKSIIGDTKATIEAIQKYIYQNNQKTENKIVEESPAESINRVLNSIASEETNEDIQKIINNL